MSIRKTPHFAQRLFRESLTALAAAAALCLVSGTAKAVVATADYMVVYKVTKGNGYYYKDINHIDYGYTMSWTTDGLSGLKQLLRFTNGSSGSLTEVNRDIYTIAPGCGTVSDSAEPDYYSSSIWYKLYVEVYQPGQPATVYAEDFKVAHAP